MLVFVLTDVQLIRYACEADDHVAITGDDRFHV